MRKYINKCFSLIHWQELVVGIAFLLMTLWYFEPMIRQPATTLPDPVDGGLISWILYRVDDNLLTGRSLFDGNIYHPYKNTLAYSDIFLTDALLTIPIYLMTGEPVAQFVLALVVSQTLMLLFLYFLLHEVTDNRMVSLVLAIIFAFSAVRLHYIGHLQMMTLQWMPLAILSLIKLTKKASGWWLVLFGASLFFQMLNSILPGMFIVLAAVMILVMMPELRMNLYQMKRQVLILVAGLMVILTPVMITYLTAFAAFDYVRPINDVMHFSLSLDELITSKYFSLGLYLTLIVGLVYFLREKKRDLLEKYFWITGFTALILSLGPALKWMSESVKIPFHIPLPYTLLYYLVPGFQAFRTPSRWIVMAVMMMLVGAGMGIARMSRQKRIIVLTLLLILGLYSIPKLPVFYIRSKIMYPQVYYWLYNQPGEVVVELPMASWGEGEKTREEVTRMLYSTLHNKRLVNGYSGFSPPEWERLVLDLKRLSLNEAIERVSQYTEVDYVVVDKLRYREELPDELAPIYEDETNVVFKMDE